jgi:phage I-like protein
VKGDEHDSDERPKLSWREIDQRRDRSRHVSSGERKPRGRAAEVRAKDATQRYLKELDDTMFGQAAGKPGSTEGRLAQAIRDAQGTAGLAEACRAYLETLGVPEDTALLAAFLDSRERELVLAALESMAARAEEGGLEVSAGLRAELRMLADEADDEVAEVAEEILERL